MSTSVKLKLLPSKSKYKEGVICMQLIHKRKVKLQRTCFRLFPYEWDNKKGTTISGKSEVERENHLQSVKEGLETEIIQLGELIRFLDEKGEYTLDDLVKLYISGSFNGFFSTFIDHILKYLKDGNRYKTAAILKTAKSSFLRFRNGQDVLLNKIDNNLILRYEAFLKKSGLMKNTISCYMRALRSAYNQAVKRGLITQKNPFINIFTRNDKTVKRAMNEYIITKLKNMDLTSHKELEFARNMFMFSFYMRGISFIDMANLRKRNVRNGYIIYSRSKTRQILTVKLEPCMREIISRYEMQTVDDYLLPIFSFQNLNCPSKLRTYNKRLKRISAMLELDKSLSSYVARHTWATIAFRKGISVEIISEGLGHENETTTRIYLASLGQSIIDKANAEVIRLG